MTEFSIDLLKPQLVTRRRTTILPKIREKHKGFVFYYAWDR